MAMPVLRFLAAVALLGPVYSQSYSVANDYESPAVPNLTPLSNLGEIVDEKISSVINSKTIQFVTPFPDSGRKSARLESAAKESIPIQHDIKYAKLQQFVANLLHPKPIHEKYGNDGGKGRAAGTALVAAVEGISNALNAAVDAPFKAAKTAGKKITKSLNQIGGKLVGLA
ncbi:hypothetical protein HUJ04_009570 [Dendroctonus ponderosae]|nr:hypothetical protein HUJ04_009570 [Dendroctonus ponderosae]